MKTPAKAPAAPKAAKAPKPPATSAAARTAPQDGDTVARQAAKAASAGSVDVNTTRAFTLHREDGTSREFGSGLNRGVTPEDADHWFVKAHTVFDPNAPASAPKSAVADVRPLTNPNGALAETAAAPAHDADKESETQALDMGKGEGGLAQDADAYSDDDAAADAARAEAGDADAKARLDAFEAAKSGGQSE